MEKKRWFGLVAIALGVAGIIVDATIVNVAIPVIFRDLKITSTQAQWIQETYTLIFASTLLLFGRMSDYLGRRRLFVLGVLIFVASSILAANSGTGDFLIGMRLLQGLGGAMMLPTSLSLLNSTFEGKERGIAFAIWGSTIGGAAALGPLLGGWLTTNLSWRWAFGINLPLGVIVIIGTMLFINESRGVNEKGVDYIGAFLSVLTMGSLVYALIEGRNLGWWRTENGISRIPLFLLAFVILLMVFIFIESKRNKAGKAVLLDLGLLSINSFRNGNIAAAIVSLGEFGLIFSLPLWMQNVLGYSAFKTGEVLLGLALGSFFASGMSVGITKKVSIIRIVQAGIGLELVGVFLVGLLIASQVNIWKIIIGLFIYGMGVGLATAQLTNVVLKDVPVIQSGQASGMQSTARQLGSALGIAILGTTFFTSFGKNLGNLSGAKELVKTAGVTISQLPAPANQVARDALSHAASTSAYVAAIFLLAGFIATLTLGRRAN